MTRLLALTLALTLALAAFAAGTLVTATQPPRVEVRDRIIVEPRTLPPVTVRVTERVTVAARADRSERRAKATAPAAVSNRLSVWARIAKCESGGRLHAVSQSGKYLGLYQLHRGFFITFGHRGDAWKDLTAGEQLEIAQYVQARQGWGAWPHCARVAGVL